MVQTVDWERIWQKNTELKSWIVTEILWKRNRTSLSSPEILLLLLFVFTLGIIRREFKYEGRETLQRSRCWAFKFWFPQIWGKWFLCGVGIGSVSVFLQVVYLTLDICYKFSVVLNLIFWLPLSENGYNKVVGMWTMVRLGERWYVPIGCQYKPPLYITPFGRKLWCKFWLGVVSPQFGEGMVVGGWC